MRVPPAISYSGLSPPCLIRTPARPEESTDIIARTLGMLERNPRLGRVQQLRPRATSQSTPNLYSGNFGLEAFPLHTDLAHWFLPPRYVLLRCVVGHRSVRTLLLSLKAVTDRVPLITLRRARFRIRRPMGDRFQFLSLVQKTSTENIFRWDNLFLIPDNKEAEQFSNLMRVEFEETTEISMERPGDTLILDNWRTLHGRSAIKSDAVCRRIDRAYFGRLSNL